MKSISFLLCRTIIMLFWLCVVNITIRANGSIVETNEQLRHIFEYTAHPTDFLYDRIGRLIYLMNTIWALAALFLRILISGFMLILKCIIVQKIQHG